MSAKQHKNFFEDMGSGFLDAIHYMGGVAILFYRTLVSVAVTPFREKQLIDQMSKIGVRSLPIVSLTGLFIGMVLALQSAYQMQKLQAEIYIPSLVAVSMLREIGPVLTALVIAGRVGASITAELGSMKVTEQIDALETLATDPIKYLVVPRFLALLVMLPLLTVYADVIGIVGGQIIGVGKLGLSESLYMRMTFQAFVLKDLFSGLTKAVVFAMIICAVSCYEGMKVEGGAEGVGAATMRSVVTSFVLVIAADCLFTFLFYFVM